MGGDPPVPGSDLERAAALLRERVGFEVGDHLRYRVEMALRALAASTGRSISEVVEALRGEEDLGGPWWRMLLARATVGETYFFRDARQFGALREAVLPTLLEERARERERVLRVWSAGCASGEELYSVAIVLRELLEHPEVWRLMLLGTDVNEEALARARQGVYRPWSFRRMPRELLTRYFVAERSLWRLHDQIRAMATFERHNLVAGPLPERTGPPAFDLILCRNVLMYMPRPAREVVAGRLRGALAPGGFLVVASVELDRRLFQGLAPERRAGVTVYRRPPAAGSSAVSTRSGAPSRPAGSGEQPARRKAGSSGCKRGGAASALRRGTSAGPPPQLPAPGSLQAASALASRARAEADRGNGRVARLTAERAVQLDPLCAEAHHVLGLLAMEQGDLDGAAGHFRRALYVDPQLVPAHLALAALVGRQGRQGASRRHRAKAVEILSRLSGESEISGEPGVPAKALLARVREELDPGSAGGRPGR